MFDVRRVPPQKKLWGYSIMYLFVLIYMYISIYLYLSTLIYIYLHLSKNCPLMFVFYVHKKRNIQRNVQRNAT